MSSSKTQNFIQCNINHC